MNPLPKAFAVVVIAAAASAQDTTRVRADNPPLWGDNVRLVREVSIGTLNGPPEYALGDVSSVAAFPDGSFFVYERTEAVIRRYDATGNYIGMVARKGSGPGEILEVEGMKTIGDSLLAVWDMGNARVSIYDRVGKRLREFTFARGLSVSGTNWFTVDPAGYVIFRVPTFEPGARYCVGVSTPDGSAVMTGCAPSRPGAPQIQYWMRYSTAGRFVDSIRVPTLPTLRRGMSFSDRPVAALLSKGGILSAWPDPYRIAMPGPNGKPMVVERPYRPIPIVGDERDEWLALYESINPKPLKLGAPKDEWFSASQLPGMPPPAPFELPNAKPGFENLDVDPLGRIWVRIYTPTTKQFVLRIPGAPGGGQSRITWRADPVYEVLDPSGRFLGRVALPPKTSLLTIAGNRVWLKSEGPDGESVIGIYRIVGTRGP